MVSAIYRGSTVFLTAATVSLVDVMHICSAVISHPSIGPPNLNIHIMQDFDVKIEGGLIVEVGLLSRYCPLFLQVNQNMLILHVVNELLELDVFDGTPRTRIDITATAGALNGEASTRGMLVPYSLYNRPTSTISPPSILTSKTCRGTLE